MRMNPTIRTAMERRDAERGEWWLARKDTDPPGKWTLTADPSGDWDWRFKVGLSKSRAVQRLRDAENAEKARLLAKAEREKTIVTAQGNVLGNPRMVDIMTTMRGWKQDGKRF